jgi:hypothetical protein
VLRLLVTANVGPSSPLVVTPMMEALCSSETLVLTKATRRNNQDDGMSKPQGNSKYIVEDLRFSRRAVL